MKAVLASMMVLVAMLVPLQAGINSTFRAHAGHPVIAALLSFAIGAAALLVATLLLRIPWPATAALAEAPWWSWLGGLCGVAMVLASIVAARGLGASLLVACLIAGQLVASLVIDHFGWVGYPVRPVSLDRLAGVALLAAGVLMIHRSA